MRSAQFRLWHCAEAPHWLCHRPAIAGVGPKKFMIEGRLLQGVRFSQTCKDKITIPEHHTTTHKEGQSHLCAMSTKTATGGAGAKRKSSSGEKSHSKKAKLASTTKVRKFEKEDAASDSDNDSDASSDAGDGGVRINWKPPARENGAGPRANGVAGDKSLYPFFRFACIG